MSLKTYGFNTEQDFEHFFILNDEIEETQRLSPSLNLVNSFLWVTAHARLTTML